MYYQQCSPLFVSGFDDACHTGLMDAECELEGLNCNVCVEDVGVLIATYVVKRF